MTVRALGAAIILLTSGAAALAADLPVTAVPVTPVWPRTWDWNGFYGGINAGGSFGEAKNFWNVPALSVTGSDRETQIGPLGGIQLGWNWQYSALLWGLEGDIDVAGQRGKATFNSPFSVTTGSGTTATITSGTVTIPLRDDLILIGTLRGRLGATFGPALVYVTGGFAWAAARQDIAGTLIKSTGSTALFINDTRLTSLPVGSTVGVRPALDATRRVFVHGSGTDGQDVCHGTGIQRKNCSRYRHDRHATDRQRRAGRDQL